MAVTFNHTIIHARDNQASAAFLTEILGLQPHRILAHFAVVQVGVTSLDYLTTDGEITPRHFAFQVSESEFDEIFARITVRGLSYWADPFRNQPGAINHWDDGRGVYFDDPDGHLMEVLTRSYGSGGLDAEHPNPLLTQ
ncbi:VOC family protein [Pacificispira sp.]|uniref:VOC family protein n=1 Tax=Pacificispira sp. TaxID=2888761 RepID=UPI003B529FAE